MFFNRRVFFLSVCCVFLCFHRRVGAGGRSASLCAFSVPDGAAVRAVLRVRLQPFPAAAVPHLRPAGAQPVLPLRRQRSFPECRVSSKQTAAQQTHKGYFLTNVSVVTSSNKKIILSEKKGVKTKIL